MEDSEQELPEAVTALTTLLGNAILFGWRSLIVLIVLAFLASAFYVFS